MAKKIEEKTGTGRRKRAVAAVRLRPGTGKINVNGRELENYFPLDFQRQKILAPLKQMGAEGSFDIIIRAKGGGIDGQAEAARLGIARALVADNEERRADLKALGFLRRDPRRRERKKYGHKGARKSFQFSKR